LSGCALLLSIINPEAIFHKSLTLKDLKQITIGVSDFLGGSVALGILQSLSHMDIVGSSLRESTGNSTKARGERIELIKYKKRKRN
jgi:hypothetical protein